MSEKSYLDYAKKKEQVETERAFALLSDAQGNNPDEYSQAHDLARMTGVPTDIAANNADDLKRRIEKARVQKRLSESKVLRDWLSQEDNAKFAHDDIEGASAVERAFKRGIERVIQAARQTRRRVHGAAGQHRHRLM